MVEKRRFSVLSVLLAGFSATSILGVGLALYIGLNAAYENTRNLWVTLADIDLTSVQRSMQQRMDSVGQRANWVADNVAEGLLDPGFQYGWDNAMRALAADEIDVMAYGLITGERQFIGYDTDDMSIVRRTLPIDDMLFSELAHLRGPITNRTSFPRWDPYFQQPVIADWVPLFYEGRYLGTFIQYLSLSNLSRSLSRGREDAPGIPFIIVAGNRVLAHPLLQQWGSTKASSLVSGSEIARSPIPLPNINDIGDPVLANLGRSERLDYTGTNTSRPDSDVQISGLELDNEFKLIVTKQIDDTPFGTALIGMHFEESLFNEEWNRLVLSSVLGGFVMLLSLAVAIIIARNFTHPIRRFAAATRKLENDLPQDLPVLPGSRIREYDDAARSFNHMVAGLRDRERISNLFGKFLPRSIAKQLLASGTDSGVLPPQQCEATVLFVDIAGFTALCEQLQPPRIVAMLNTYFDMITNIIEEHGGIITQFQGDAVLAVFNAFDELQDHADAALDTAINIQKSVRTTRFDGQELRCRCGINTGGMIAGNVGATDRLSFTVHGDAVNSAARLETENKILGTEILLSETTRDLLSAPERVIRAGEIQLRGRSEKTAVYTVSLTDITPQ
ncbi:adenylate/guanylate cyclase domain-containing protein [Thalassospira sp.]|uniref:adenylate/guanylate cyclase domain-containing protein n=1 Tax=Thalassospira sp. TaxID=1912094 RepID=UPI002736F407|nr:adenylate/guanylate cyclase domain-containing protein [Thalassospira sp.]MDP2698177.1 adenylate/guanylate cyclase domain-containing protein [Thalassospira sp.]